MLFVSGYTAGQLPPEVLGAGRAFLAKPFTPEVLVQRARELLESAPPASGPRPPWRAAGE